MNHNHGKHMLLMLACCLIPIALILAVSLFGLSLGALTPYIPFALVLLCPLMMIFMMRDMFSGNKQTDEHAHHHADPKPNELARGAKVDATPNRE